MLPLYSLVNFSIEFYIYIYIYKTLALPFLLLPPSNPYQLMSWLLSFSLHHHQEKTTLSSFTPPSLRDIKILGLPHCDPSKLSDHVLAWFAYSSTVVGSVLCFHTPSLLTQRSCHCCLVDDTHLHLRSSSISEPGTPKPILCLSAFPLTTTFCSNRLSCLEKLAKLATKSR
jgi:hypothetical protein